MKPKIWCRNGWWYCSYFPHAEDPISLGAAYGPCPRVAYLNWKFPRRTKGVS